MFKKYFRNKKIFFDRKSQIISLILKWKADIHINCRKI